MANPAPHRTRASLILLLAGILLVGFNLRPALTSVSPVLLPIGDTLGLGGTGLGVLTTLPVIALGLAAPFAARMAQKLGMELAVFFALLVLIAALLIRPYVGLSGLFIGTVFAGVAIGIMNVLLPGIVKRDFAKQVGFMTGVYTLALNAGAASAAGATEPLRLFFAKNWQPALAFWAVPAVIGALIWWWHLSQRPQDKPPKNKKPASVSLWKQSLAWQVTLFMGLQSSLAYIVFGWLPTILNDRGLSAVAAGLALSVSMFVQAIASLIIPTWAARQNSQSFALVLVLILTFIGLAGCLYGPLSGVWIWAVVLGLGQGGTFSMALTLLVLRAATPRAAASLSGMAQGFGYLVAAAGPLLMGIMHDSFGNWGVTGWLLLIIWLGAFVAAIGAGRNRYVEA